MKVQFKLRSDARERGRQMLGKLRSKGVEVRQLFPEESDAELCDLYIAEVGDAAESRRLLETLQRSPVVEFAETEVERRLIR
jgi:hypothetical protein